MRRYSLGNVFCIFLCASLLSLGVQSVFLSLYPWDNTRRQRGADLLQGAPPRATAPTKQHIDLNSVRSAAEDAVLSVCQYSGSQHAPLCRKKEAASFTNIKGLLTLLRDIGRTSEGGALRIDNTTYTVLDVAQTAASYFGVTRPRKDVITTRGLSRQQSAVRFQTIIASARQDGTTIYGTLNALHSAGVYRDIHVSWGHYEGTGVLPDAVRDAVDQFESVNVTILPQEIFELVQTLRRDRPWAFGHWLVHANYWQAFSLADPSIPMLFLEDDVIPASFFSLRLARIVAELNEVVGEGMYVLDLVVPYDWRDHEEVVPGVCKFADTLKNFYGTQALFLSPGLSPHVAAWYRMFAEGAPGTPGAGDMPVDLAFKEFLHAVRADVNVFAVKESLMQHRCGASTLKGTCWEAQNFVMNPEILMD